MAENTGIRVLVSDLLLRIGELTRMEEQHDVIASQRIYPFDSLSRQLETVHPGTLLTWGAGYSDRSSDMPLPFYPLRDRVITSIACGLDHTAAIDIRRCLFCWGGNKHGQAGLPPCLEVVTPCKLAGQVDQVACGYQATFYVSKKKAFGVGRMELLGLGQEHVEAMQQLEGPFLW